MKSVGVHQVKHRQWMFLGRVSSLLLLLGLFAVPASADWSSFWRTPAQQAADALEDNDFDRLRRVAPDQDWEAIAEHKAGEYENAQQALNGLIEQLQDQGESDALNRALYNRGVNEVRSGQYEDAVSSFDEVLQRDPEFADARHNKAIAEQLIQQQQQSSQNQDAQGDDAEGEQDQSEPGDRSDEGESGESGESSQSEQNEAQPQEGQQGDSDQEQPDGQESAENESGESQSQQERDAQAARDALDAEARADAMENAQNPQGENADQEGDRQQGPEQAMSESEQATEQWLRRIPDDPAGLLRRKLEHSHRTEFPRVGDASEPW